MQKHTAKESILKNFTEREKMLPSQKILNEFGLLPGHVIADLGCGFGYFTFKIAEMAESNVKIQAVDIEPERLNYIELYAKEKGIDKLIQTHLVKNEKIPLADESVDIALIANVLHELEDPSDYLKEAFRIVKKPKGQLWIVEWQFKETPYGPPLNERKSEEEWISLLANAGFVFEWAKNLEPAHILIKGLKQ